MRDQPNKDFRGVGVGSVDAEGVGSLRGRGRCPRGLGSLSGPICGVRSKARSQTPIGKFSAAAEWLESSGRAVGRGERGGPVLRAARAGGVRREAPSRAPPSAPAAETRPASAEGRASDGPRRLGGPTRRPGGLACGDSG